MAEARKVIISCAITGAIHTPSMSPHLPVTPQQIAPGRQAESNADQVRQVRGIIEGLGLDIATPAEARRILDLKGGDQVAF